MKNTMLVSCLLLISLNMAAQDLILDTIFANDTKNVALFFEEPIQQGITGAENFIFTYNREKEQFFGLLQATPGTESNLLVLSSSGSIFSYIVKYSKDLKKLNYFIADTSSIGNFDPNFLKVKSSLNGSIGIDKSNKYLSISRDLYFDNFCAYLIRKKEQIGRIRKRNEDIILRVENIVFNKDQFYFVMEIENRSSIDFEINFLNLSVQTKQKGKRTSMQKLELEPIYKYKMPERINKGATASFVYVIPKLSIADDKMVILDLNEKNGERDLKLKIKQRFINHPN